MQLTTNSSTPSICLPTTWWVSWTCGLENFKWYAKPYVSILVLDSLIFIECPAFKGCCWRAIPAHPQCANRLSDKSVELTSPRTFKWYAKPWIAVFALDQSVQFVPFWKWWKRQKWLLKPLEVGRGIHQKKKKWQILAAYSSMYSWVIFQDNN